MPRATTWVFALGIGLSACGGARAPGAKAAVVTAADVEQDPGATADAAPDAGIVEDVAPDAIAPTDAPTCTTATCDDGNPCTADLCDAKVGCGHKALPDGGPCGVGTCSGVCLAGECTPTELFEAVYTGGGEDLPAAMVALPDGFAIAGVQGSLGIGILRTDLQGNGLWAKTYGNQDNSITAAVPMALLKLSDGFALAAEKGDWNGYYDGWLLRTDASGDKLWEQTYGGGAFDSTYAMAALADGFALAGITESKGNGKGDFWLIRTDLDGKRLWDEAYGTNTLEAARGLVALSDGFALVGSRYEANSMSGKTTAWLVRTDTAGIVLWDQIYGADVGGSANALVSVPSGFVFAGAHMLPGPSQLWLVRTDTAGKLLWQRDYDAGPGAAAESLIADSNGLAFTAGKNKNDAWLFRTDTAGNLQWMQKRDGNAYGYGYVSLAATADGFAWSGWQDTSGPSSYDIWLRRTDFWGNNTCADSGACAAKPASACVTCAKGVCL